MQDAGVKRLSRILADDDPQKKKPLTQVKKLVSFRMAEGWFSFFLLALVIYSTIWCVQTIGWVPHLNSLSAAALFGLLLGVYTAKKSRLPALLSHALALVLSLLFALWMTISSDYAGNTGSFIGNIQSWFNLIGSGGNSTDYSIFLLFILVLGFLLAYTSAWLLYRTRSPWLLLIANAVVLLINLNNADVTYIVFLIIFLIAALLLLLRFNLYESTSRWKRQGLRCADDLSWEYMQAGSLICLGILVLAWLLPWGYVNDQSAQIWSADNNPWTQVQGSWNRLFASTGGAGTDNHGNFTNILTLGGNPHLTNVPVFQVKTNDGTQYLGAVSYDQYDGSRNWLNSQQTNFPFASNTKYYDGSQLLRQVNQTITVVNPPGEQTAYIFGASQIVATNTSGHMSMDKADSQVTAWIGDKGKLASGNVYNVTSYVSNADIQSLKAIPFPADSPKLPTSFDGEPPVSYFDPHILQTYTKLPAGLDPRIKQLAQQVAGDAKTMYDQVVALEAYLRDNYTYNANIQAPPAGYEATSWFLFQSKEGFCNYFATSMALMARELGLPSRVEIGYTHGSLNTKTGLWTVVGTDAHAWTQIYFAGYGWLNFEPSASFATFVRPLLPASTGNGVASTPLSGQSTNGNTPNRAKGIDQDPTGAHPTGSVAVTNQNQLQAPLTTILIVLLIVLLAGLVYLFFWWRGLFKGLSPTSQVYGRVAVLASMAGIAGNRAQTPGEYMQRLSTAVPEEAVTFERLGDIYTRERWAALDSSDHPSTTGESAEIPRLWRTLQPSLLKYILHHPRFLRRLPSQALAKIRLPLFRRRRQQESPVVVEEEVIA